MTLWWTTKALPWLKKNWQWILLPIGILLTLSKFFKPRLESVSAESLGAAKTEADANAKASKAATGAQAKRDEKIADLAKDVAEARDDQVDSLRKKTEEIKNSPEKVNEHLLDVGRRIRKP